MKKILIVCTTDSMIWNFLIPHIKELEARGFYVECASCRTGYFFEELEGKCNIKMNEISFARSPYNTSNLKAYKSLVELIKAKKFDTVFCHEPVGGALGRLAGKKCGCEIIYMAHGFHFFKGAPKSRIVYYWVEKFLSRYTDTLITINQEDYEASLEFFAKENYKINGIGVDTTKFKKDISYKSYLSDEFNFPADAKTVLSVGELIPRKNHSVIIKAIKKLDRKNVFYFIAGNGGLEEDLHKLIDDLELSKQVFLLGYRNDISKLCNAADVFALPSVHEGLSVALMEAMGCGKPILASRIRGNIDLVDEGLGGYLVPTYDVDEYAIKLKKLLDSDETEKSMGAYNMEKVKEFDIKSVKAQLMNIIGEKR